MYRQFSAIS